MSENMKELVGCHLTDFTMENEILSFHTDKGEIVYQAVGDCCSYTWWESIDNEDALRDATVLSAEDCEMPDAVDNHPEEHDQVQFYGVKIHTTKGDATIDFRNDSNGYYGGWYQLVGQR